MNGGTTDENKTVSVSLDKLTNLSTVVRQICNVFLISAPKFAPGSVGAQTVFLAKNINQIIEELRNTDKPNEKK